MHRLSTPHCVAMGSLSVSWAICVRSVPDIASMTVPLVLGDPFVERTFGCVTFRSRHRLLLHDPYPPFGGVS